MDMQRLVLRGALLGLVEGFGDEESIQKNIRICLENMSDIYEQVDDIRLQQKRSGDSHWTQRALDQTDLKQLGNFSVNVKSTKKKRIISFMNEEGESICFVFAHLPKDILDRLEPTIHRMEGQGEEQMGKMASAFMTSVMLATVGGKNVSPEEILLGSKPSTLGEYSLQSVEKLGSPSGFFRTWRKTVLYVVPS